MLNLLYYLGFFPFKIEDGNVTAINTWRYAVTVLITTIVVLASFCFSIYIYGFDTFVNVLVNSIFGLTLVDKIAFNMNTLTFYTIYTFVFWKIIQIKEEVAQLMTFLKPYSSTDKRCRFCISALIIPISALLQSVGIFIMSKEEETFTKPFFISFVILIEVLWFNFPSVIFNWTFVKTMELIENWIEKIKENSLTTEITQTECIDLVNNGLRRANKIFSSTLFSYIIMILLMAIIVAYMTISFLIKLDLGSGLCFVIGAFCLFSLYFILQLHTINTRCQKIMDKLEELKENLYIKDPNSTSIGILNFFKGFDCNGYFILGKSFFTSITADFITYIIILIQFKISE